MTPSELRSLEFVGATLLRFIAPAIILQPKTDTPKDVLHNGTFSYVSTGKTTLLVTSAHVWEEFERMQAEDASTVLGWFPAQGVSPVDLSDQRPTDFDRNSIDLCTFETKLNCDLAEIGKNWAEVLTWPPARVQVGDLVIGVGFPGANRREVTDGDGKVGLMMVASVVSGNVKSVSDRHFVVADEDMERYMVNIGEGSYVPQFGGMSGGVFFKVVEGEQENRFNLAGFLYEVYDVHQQGHHTNANLYVTHADFIGDDGKIDRSKFLW